MSDTDSAVLELLDRAAAHTPPLHLAREDVIARGEQIVRRRRAGRAGMTVGGLALAGAVWLGTGLGGGALLGTQEVSPAGVTWEAEVGTTVTLLDGQRLDDGRTWTVTLSKDAGSSTATFVVDGKETVVPGRPSWAGLETFPAEHGTLVVWAGQDVTVTHLPHLPVDLAGAVSGQEGAVQWSLLREGASPDDIVLSDGDSAWTAGGEVAQTADLRDGRVRLTGASFSERGVAGYLDRGSFYEVDTLTVSSVDRPWWRGGGFDVVMVARLPEEAVFAREVLRDDPDGEVLEATTARRTTEVGDSDLVLLVSGWQGGGGEATDRMVEVQWSADGQNWHDQEHQDPTVGVEPGPVGPGGSVVLLDETYEVATDAHGWPMLIEEDGSTFLTVSDPDGPPTGDGGGIIMWREHWWPWSDRNEVHFAVDGQPVVGPEVETQDPVTISGPAGVVGLIAVPAGS